VYSTRDGSGGDIIPTVHERNKKNEEGMRHFDRGKPRNRFLSNDSFYHRSILQYR
jgi:hypothetical protein